MERKTHINQLRERIGEALGRQGAQKELAAVMDVTKQYLNALEQGAVPGPKTIRKFATVFSIPSVTAWVLLSHEMTDAEFEGLASRLVPRAVELIEVARAIEKQSGGIANGDGKTAGAHVATASVAGLAVSAGGHSTRNEKDAGCGVEVGIRASA